ncbi:MAG: hypothetical protein HZA03_06910 [Nitrospinae bacterium]|nr:hypothetical protein [Nitrospinota bacterium]
MEHAASNIQEFSGFISGLKARDLTGLNEAAIKQTVILPFFSKLGWNTHEPNEVHPEHTIGSKRVDFALIVNGSKKVFIEVKKSGIDLSEHEEQILQYSFQEGIELAILTNGLLWWFYLPLMSGNWAKRRFLTLDISRTDDDAVAASFSLLLGKEKHVSGDFLLTAKFLYELGICRHTAVPKKKPDSVEVSKNLDIDETLSSMLATLKPTTDVQYPWLVKHEGKAIRLTADDLMNFKKFSAICMEQLRFLPAQMNKDAWRNLIVDKLNQVKDVPPEQFVDDLNDITDNYKFRYLLEQFFTKNPARKVNEITLGRAFLSRDVGYQFQLKDFAAYLASHGFKSLSSRDLTPMLRKLGGDNKQRIWDGHKTLNVWSMPANLFEKHGTVEPAEMEGEGE